MTTEAITAPDENTTESVQEETEMESPLQKLKNLF